jgi:hypothetical protein
MRHSYVKAAIVRGDKAIGPKPTPGGIRLLVIATVVAFRDVGENIAVHGVVIQARTERRKAKTSFRWDDSGANQVLEAGI